MRISTLLFPSRSRGIERASRLCLIGLLIVLASFWPPLPAPLAQGATAWEVAKGEPADWKILSDRLECTISEPSAHWVISDSPVYGDFVIEASLGPAFEKGEGLFFAASKDLSQGYLLTPGVTTTLYKISGSDLTPIAAWPLGYGTPNGIHAVRLVKKGATYSFSFEGRVLNTLTDPGWNTGSDSKPSEPDGGYWGFAFYQKGTHRVTSWRMFQIPSAELFTENPVVAPGPEGGWDQLDVFSGAVLKDEGKFYLYYDADYKPFATGVYTETLHRIGVATSTDLEHWTKYQNNPVFGPPLEGDTVKFFGLPPSVNHATLQGGGGVVRLPNGHFALTFNVQSDVQWLGVWLAESASPLGPFHKAEPGHILSLGNPTDFDGEHIHLHAVIRKPDGSYALLYTGFSSHLRDGRPGDRGGLATSTDMVHWTKYRGNPVFAPGEPGTWDDRHVRPKTVARLGGWYYMFYEGAHPTDTYGKQWWPDQVGMARSKDLIHWDRYPYNPIIPATTSKHFGNLANIQPAAVASGDALYVFYGCLEAGKHFAVCGARIPKEALDLWGKR